MILVINHILTCVSGNNFSLLNAENPFHCMVAEKCGTWPVNLGTTYALLQHLSVQYGVSMEEEREEVPRNVLTLF